MASWTFCMIPIIHSVQYIFAIFGRGELHRNDLGHTIKPCHWSRWREDTTMILPKVDPLHTGSRPYHQATPLDETLYATLSTLRSREVLGRNGYLCVVNWVHRRLKPPRGESLRASVRLLIPRLRATSSTGTAPCGSADEIAFSTLVRNSFTS